MYSINQNHHEHEHQQKQHQHHDQKQDQFQKQEQDQDEFWIITQITDSGFPGGALSHSQGLESALLHGLISMKDEPEQGLVKFINMSLLQANSQVFPILLHAWKLSYHCSFDNNKWLNDISIVDGKCQLILNNNVSRRSSVNQGKCFLRASKEAFFTNSNISSINNQEKIKLLSKVLQTKTDMTIYGHYPIIFGIVCGLLNISELITKKIFFRCFIRDMFSSAYRLNIIGPLEGANLQAIVCKNLQKILYYDNKYIDEYNNDNKKRKYNDINDNSCSSIEDMNFTTTSPIIEILQGRHDILYCRLFNS